MIRPKPQGTCKLLEDEGTGLGLFRTVGAWRDIPSIGLSFEHLP